MSGIFSPLSVLRVGACTPVGLTAAASAAAVRAGISRFRALPDWVDRYGEPFTAAPASYLPPELELGERLQTLLVPAAQQALLPRPAQSTQRPAVALFLALPSARPGLPADLENRLGSALRDTLQDQVRLVQTVFHRGGHAAGLRSLLAAQAALHRGGAELCLVGAVDSYLAAETLEWLDESDQLKSPANRWGFIPGEGAGFCLLARSSTTSSTAPGPVLRTVGLAHEHEGPHTGRPCLGLGLTQALRAAISVLSPSERIDEVFCDQNGARLRSDEYGFTIARLGNRFVDPTRFTTAVDCWGDQGAASVLLSLILACAAGSRGYGRGPHAVIVASSADGERGAALLHVPVQPRTTQG